MRVYFVRHGETTHNAAGIYQHGAVELSERGLEQAETVAKRLKSVEFDVIISSDYARARQTTEAIIRATSKEAVFTELARERRIPSELHDKPHNDPSIQDLHKEIEGNIHNPDYRHSDEENFFDMKSRAKRLLEFLESRPEENLVVVLHGTILRYVFCVMAYGDSLNWDTYIGLARFIYLNNTGITVCEQQEGRWKLITWNDHAHLGELK